MAMDIIYKKETKFDEDNNFSIELSSNNEIQNMVFKSHCEWLVSGLTVVVRKFVEYKQVKKVSDLINKIKAGQKDNIAHGSIKCYLPNFTAFEHDHFVNFMRPNQKTYKYYNVETKKMDQIQFPDYKNWYKNNKAVWKTNSWGNTKFILEYVDETKAHVIIRRRQWVSSKKANLMLILERMNKVHTKNGDRLNDSTDWIHYFYGPNNKWQEVYLRQYPASFCFWEDIQQKSLKIHTEDTYKKRAYNVYSNEKNFTGVTEKDSFLVHDDEKHQGIVVHKERNVKYYVSVEHYLNRKHNFLRFLTGATYVLRDADTEFPNHYASAKRGYYEKNVYEVLIHSTTADIKTVKYYDFIIPFNRPITTDTYHDFLFLNEKYFWDNCDFSDELKNKIFEKGRRISPYNSYTVNIKPDDFVSQAEKEIELLMTPTYFKELEEIKNNQSIQSSFFYMIDQT